VYEHASRLRDGYFWTCRTEFVHLNVHFKSPAECGHLSSSLHAYSTRISFAYFTVGNVASELLRVNPTVPKITLGVRMGCIIKNIKFYVVVKEVKRGEVTGVWRKLHNEELHGLYSSPSIVG
jgi:hypothetical protein